MDLKLKTFRQDDYGTFGEIFTASGASLGYSVEQPWRNNEPFNSCVPAGKYLLVPHNSKKYGRCFVLHNPTLQIYAEEDQMILFDDRYLCIFAHKGSYPKNFEGCIGAGDHYGNDMIYNTRVTCKKIMNLLYSSNEQHTLTIERL